MACGCAKRGQALRSAVRHLARGDFRSAGVRVGVAARSLAHDAQRLAQAKAKRAALKRR